MSSDNTVSAEQIRDVFSQLDNIPIEMFPEKYHSILKSITEKHVLNYAKLLIATSDITPQELKSRLFEYVTSYNEHIHNFKRKTIYVFHFKTKEDLEFDPEDNNYCKEYGQTYPYTIRYYTVNSEISDEGKNKLRDTVKNISEMDQTLNQMLFIDEVGGYDMSLFARIKRFLFKDDIESLKILSYIKDYIRNATVFFLHSLASGIRAVSREKLEEYGIVVKKCLNIHIVNAVGMTRRAITATQDNRTYDIKDAAIVNSDKLICQSWFTYFSDIAFGCIKNRVMQTSGTCYLNAVINGFILSPTIRKIILDIAKRENRSVYSKPLNLEICERKTDKYIFRIMYNMICSKVSLKDTSAYKKDIMVEFSKLYSNDKTGKGQGGNTSKTVIKILDVIDPDYICMGYSKYPIYPTDTSKFITSEYSDMGPVKNGTGDFLMIYEGGDIYEVITYNEDKFLIQFVCISILCSDGGHAVCGIKCDGKYLIYDSNEDILNINWTLIFKDSTVRKTLLDWYSEKYQRKHIDVTTIELVPVYIRESAIRKYENVSSEALCDAL